MNTQKFTQKCTLQCKNLYNLHEILYKNVHYSVKICVIQVTKAVMKLHKNLHKKLHYSVKICIISSNNISRVITQNIIQNFTQKFYKKLHQSVHYSVKICVIHIISFVFSVKIMKNFESP